MKLLITTQVYENYGDAQNPHWKAKGSMDYVVKNFKQNHSVEAVMALRSKIECDNEMYREHIIDWSIVADDYLTEFERSQLEYDGQITYSPEELVWQ